MAKYSRYHLMWSLIMWSLIMFSHGLCDQFVIHLASINQYSPKKPFWLMLSFFNVEAVLIAFTLPHPHPPFPPLLFPLPHSWNLPKEVLFFYLSFQQKNTCRGVKKSIKKWFPPYTWGLDFYKVDLKYCLFDFATKQNINKSNLI